MMRRTITAQAPPIDRVAHHAAVTTQDMLGMAWLCEMAALGCLHVNRSAWAAQLRDDARTFRHLADQADAAGRLPQGTTRRPSSFP